MSVCASVAGRRRHRRAVFRTDRQPVGVMRGGADPPSRLGTSLADNRCVRSGRSCRGGESIMITEDQTAVTEFLGSSSTHDGVPVERIDTHTAVVFLAGTRAWKLKRAVLFDYLDFSTAAQRKALCDAEVRLNRRTAPTLY